MFRYFPFELNRIFFNDSDNTEKRYFVVTIYPVTIMTYAELHCLRDCTYEKAKMYVDSRR